ncbi:ATP-grasp domain-containing protein [bacterium]|nr:ATP-grasp domain-containing protein [bacterium]
MKVLITGGGGNAARSVIDCLRCHHMCLAIDTNPYHLAASNAHDSEPIVPVSHPDYLDNINQIISKYNIDYIHPQPDVETLYISQHRDKIKTKTFLPNPEVIELTQNKLLAIECFQKNNIATPQSYFLSEGTSKFNKLKEINEKVWVRAIRGAGSKAALPVLTYDQAISWCDYWCTLKGMTKDDFIMSEFLPGTEYAVQTLWHEGELMASQARERSEYFFGSIMPSGQSSTPSIACTIHDSRVYKTAYQAIKAIDNKPHGIYCVDIKENSEGIPCIMEINCGRFFTTSNFFAALDVNMPMMICDMLETGKALPKNKQKIESITDCFWWVRGLDKTPTLLNQNKEPIKSALYSGPIIRHKRIAIDYDGTLVDDLGNIENFNAQPKMGAAEITQLLKQKGFELIIFTCRPEEHRKKLQERLAHFNIHYDELLFNIKPRVDMYVDDKAITFTTWHDLRNLISMLER